MHLAQSALLGKGLAHPCSPSRQLCESLPFLFIALPCTDLPHAAAAVATTVKPPEARGPPDCLLGKEEKHDSDCGALRASTVSGCRLLRFSERAWPEQLAPLAEMPTLVKGGARGQKTVQLAMREDEVRDVALSLCPRVLRFMQAAVTSHL